jgi:hypothetical protein
MKPSRPIPIIFCVTRDPSEWIAQVMGIVVIADGISYEQRWKYQSASNIAQSEALLCIQRGGFAHVMGVTQVSQPLHTLSAASNISGLTQ